MDWWLLCGLFGSWVYCKKPDLFCLLNLWRRGLISVRLMDLKWYIFCVVSIGICGWKVSIVSPFFFWNSWWTKYGFKGWTMNMGLDSIVKVQWWGLILVESVDEWLLYVLFMQSSFFNSFTVNWVYCKNSHIFFTKFVEKKAYTSLLMDVKIYSC